MMMMVRMMMMMMVLACQERESDVGDVGLHCTSCGGPEGTKDKRTFQVEKKIEEKNRKQIWRSGGH